MKIAISAKKDDINSEISELGGRAPFYLIFEKKKLIKKIKNPFAVGGGGAGFAVAKMLKNEKVNLVITGRIGPNMEMALNEYKIKFKKITGKTVKQILNKV